MNVINEFPDKYQLVTCFETLERVGDIDNAFGNLMRLVDKTGTVVISVPIETGVVGIIKFLVKTVLYSYNLDEINTTNHRHFYWRYFCSLLMRKDISRFRLKRSGYGTHFGFDAKSVERRIKSEKKSYRKIRRGTTMFYIVKC